MFIPGYANWLPGVHLTHIDYHPFWYLASVATAKLPSHLQYITFPGLPPNLSYKTPQTTKPKYFLSGLEVFFAQSIKARR